MNNKDIIVIAKKDENINRIKTIFKLIGYNLFLADDLNSAFNFIERFPPLAILVTEEEEETTKIYLKELKRHLPVTPLIVLMNKKDYTKREEYLKYTYDVIEQPWTELNIAQSLNLLEIKKIKEQKIKKETKKEYLKNLFYLFSITILIITSFLILLKIMTSKINKEEKKIEEIKIPSKNITGLFEKDSHYYIYDWTIQSFYILEKGKDNIVSIKNFFTPYIITSIKDSQLNFFFAITDNNEIKKILKDDKFREVYSLKSHDNILDVCYDGMYIWALQEDYLIKIFDNEKGEIIERHMLPQELLETKHLACNNDEIFYYKEQKIYIANIKNPIKINKRLITDNKVISLNYLNKKLILIMDSSNNSSIKELQI